MDWLRKLIHAIADAPVDREIKAAQKDYERETMGEWLGLKSHNPYMYRAFWNSRQVKQENRA